MVKLLLVALFIAAVISLFTGLVFMMKDQGPSRRIIYSLYLRVALCIALVVLVIVGFYTGTLVTHAPWAH